MHVDDMKESKLLAENLYPWVLSDRAREFVCLHNIYNYHMKRKRELLRINKQKNICIEMEEKVSVIGIKDPYR